MRRIVLTLVTLTCCITTAQAQTARAATLDDSLRVTAKIFKELFQGDSLTAQEQPLAKAAILDAFRASMTLPGMEPCAARVRLMQIAAQRDSILLALLHSADDSAAFRKRAFPMSPHGPCPYHN